MSKSRIWSRLLHHRFLSCSPLKHSLASSSSPPFPATTRFTSSTITIRRNYCTNFFDLSPHARNAAAERALQEITYQAQNERIREREERIKAGLDTADLDREEDEDYMGVNPLIEKLMKEEAKGGDNEDLNRYDEPTDSDTDDDDDRLSAEAELKRINQFEKKFKKHEELLDKFTNTGTLNDAYQFMKKIDKFEEKYFHPRLEYRVIGELMNRMKVAEGKEKFLLQVKLNRALRMVEWSEAFGPNIPSNYGIIQDEQAGGGDMDDEIKTEEQAKKPGGNEDEESDFDDMKEKDTVLLKKLSELDKELEQKLAELDHTFGKKGKLLEEEIRDLAEERNSLTEQKRQPLYRKGFDVKLIDVNRTCKVTKGGQVVKNTAMLAGWAGREVFVYHGVVGFAKAKGPAIPVALQKANGGREGNTWAYKNTNLLIKGTLEKNCNAFHTLAHRHFHSEGNSIQVPFMTSNKKQYVSGVSQKERSPQARATNICIKLKSFDQPFLENWELPPHTKQIGLPESRVLYTVLRSPHIDKKSREQFEMRIKKTVIKTETNDLRKKLFWLKRQRIFGAQCEILISCKTRLDKKKLQSLL